MLRLSVLRDPKEIWETLKNTIQSVSEASINAYLVQYQNIRMPEYEKIVRYVNRLREVQNKFAEIGHKPETDERRVLLRGLREEFSITAEVIRGTDKKIENSVALLVVSEATISDGSNSNTPTNNSQALTTQTEKNCSHCGRKEYIKEECYHNLSCKNHCKRGSN